MDKMGFGPMMDPECDPWHPMYTPGLEKCKCKEHCYDPGLDPSCSDPSYEWYSPDDEWCNEEPYHITFRLTFNSSAKLTI